MPDRFMLVLHCVIPFLNFWLRGRDLHPRHRGYEPRILSYATTPQLAKGEGVAPPLHRFGDGPTAVILSQYGVNRWSRTTYAQGFNLPLYR